MIIVPPQLDEELPDDQSERIVFGHIEYQISDLVTDQNKGGKFTAIGMNSLTENHLDWRIMPEDRNIFITWSGSKGLDTECCFEYRP